MDLNLPPYIPPQANTACKKPTHTQHLTQSQYMPLYMAHPYYSRAAPQPPPERPYPNKC